MTNKPLSITNSIMREIKFQLLDPIDNHIHWYERLEDGRRKNRWINESKDSYGNGIYQWVFIRRQYTWIKDKNWKEIYEGDIVESNWCFWIVEFFDNLHYDWSRWKHSWFYINTGEDFDWELYWSWFDDCEVKGNIRENKDLLSNQ